jgi:hypothetical protein
MSQVDWEQEGFDGTLGGSNSAKPLLVRATRTSRPKAILSIMRRVSFDVSAILVKPRFCA